MVCGRVLEACVYGIGFRGVGQGVGSMGSVGFGFRASGFGFRVSGVRFGVERGVRTPGVRPRSLHLEVLSFKVRI